MPRLQLKATELVGTDVNFVSLVKRGANRIPFRITKEDEPMLDLGKIGRSFFKKSEPQPQIVAAIFKADADVNQVAAIFKTAGLDPKSFVKTEQDGIITVAIEGADKVEDAALLKVNDDIGLMVSGLKKAFHSYDFASNSFAEVLAVGGHYASICNATDALNSTIYNILGSSDTPTDAASKISTAVDGFKNYVATLTSALPVHAFKADVELTKAAAGKAKAKDNDMDDEDDKKSETKKEGEGAEIEKADAGKNGTGAGFEAGQGTGTTPSATADDAANTAINATGSESTTGNADEGPVEAKKEEVKGLPQPTGHEPGDADGFAAPPTDSQGASARASADDKKMKLNGGTDGSSIPDGNSGLDRLGGVHKNEGDAEIGKTGTGNTLPEDQSGAGAQQAGEQDGLDPATLHKGEDPVLAALAALQKSLADGLADVRKEISTVNGRVDDVATMARKTDAALNGTVFNEEGGDDHRQVQKSDAGCPPLLDTAYDRRAA